MTTQQRKYYIASLVLSPDGKSIIKSRHGRRGRLSCIRPNIEDFPNMWFVFNNVGIGWNGGVSFYSREQARKYIHEFPLGKDSIQFKIVKYKRQTN